MVKTFIPLTVDPEFRDLCPPLTDDERAMLRESIIADGCRDAIVFWDTKGSPIIDGYHRHEICRGEGIKFDTIGMDFPDRRAVRCWILRNQLGRRNLTDAARSIARGRLYNELKGQQGGDHTTPQKERAKGQNEPLLSTAAGIGAPDGVSASTVKRDAKLAESVDALHAKSPELAQAIAAGTIPTSAAAPLAEAPKAELRKLEKLDGAELRKAAKETAENIKEINAPAPPPVKQKRHTATAPKSKNGQPTFDPAKFKVVYEYLGHALPKLGVLNRSHPTKFYQQAENAVKVAMQAVQDWKRAVQP